MQNRHFSAGGVQEAMQGSKNYTKMPDNWGAYLKSLMQSINIFAKFISSAYCPYHNQSLCNRGLLAYSEDGKGGLNVMAIDLVLFQRNNYGFSGPVVFREEIYNELI